MTKADLSPAYAENKIEIIKYGCAVNPSIAGFSGENLNPIKSKSIKVVVMAMPSLLINCFNVIGFPFDQVADYIECRS